MEEIKTHSRLAREFFFWTGIIATFAYRIIIVLTDYPAIWLEVAWYIGTIGFTIYFIHRYQISERRALMIRNRQLAEKVKNFDGLEAGDKEAMEYIFKTLESSKEKWNYIFIFATSGLALVWGLVTDLLAVLK